MVCRLYGDRQLVLLAEKGQRTCHAGNCVCVSTIVHSCNDGILWLALPVGHYSPYGSSHRISALDLKSLSWCGDSRQL